MYTLISPWPPQRNGIADYAYEIVRNGNSSVRLFTEALRPTLITDRVAAIDAQAFARDPGDRRLYHFGNNFDHVFEVPLFLRDPGHVVLHDASLHYLAQGVDRVLPGFLRQILSEETTVNIPRLMKCWGNGLKTAMDYAELQCLRWLRKSPGIIVHSHYAKQLSQPLLPEVPFHVIPHFAYLRPGLYARRSQARAEARAALGIGEDQLLLVTFGFVTKNKQYASILKALTYLPRAERSRIQFKIAGEVRVAEYDLDADIAPYDTSGVEVMGYVASDMADTLLDAADLVVSLRNPTYGESSGAVARAQGAGAVLVVSNGGAFREIPDETCFKVPAKGDVSRELAQILGQVLADPAIVAAKRDAAWTFAHDILAPRRCADRFEEVLYA